MTAQQLFSDHPQKPRLASVRRLAVHGTHRLSPGFVRLTLASTGDGFEDDFEYLGFDQWVRLFLPTTGTSLHLPDGQAKGWHTRWRAMAEPVRPIVRNYTIRAARRSGSQWLLDVDLVVHHRPDDGKIAGVAANWALRAEIGDHVGVLDQGRIFQTPTTTASMLIIADESGLPGVEGIARSLAGQPAHYILELPCAQDQRELTDATHTNWLVRRPDQASGEAAIAALTDVDLAQYGYVYAVGESTLALAVRERARAAGIPDDHIDFCGYWRRTD